MKVPSTDGKEKLIRRRIIVRKIVYNPTEETGVAPIKYDEYDVNSPEVTQLDPEVKIWADDFVFSQLCTQKVTSLWNFRFYTCFIVVLVLLSCLLSCTFASSDIEMPLALG